MARPSNQVRNRAERGLAEKEKISIHYCPKAAKEAFDAEAITQSASQKQAIYEQEGCKNPS